MLRSQYRQTITSRQLEVNARTQEKAAQRESTIAAATVRLQRAGTLADLARVFLEETHALFGVLQGAVYVRDGNHPEQLHLAGSFACADPLPATLRAGEGLLGQCAVERRSQLLPTVPEGFATIRSGLGETRPAAVWLAPVLMNENLLGVVELALLHVPDESELKSCNELASLLAMNIEIVGRSAQTEEILSATREAEQASARQLAFQNALLETIPYPMFYKDTDARFLGVNRAYEKCFGVERNDLIGKCVLDLDYLPMADRIAYQTEDEATIAGIGTVEREMKIPFADGQLHDTLYFVSGFADDEGQPAGLIGTFIDMTTLKDAERELDLLADLQRFHRLAQGREQRILALKREVNALAEAGGKAAPYATTLIETVEDHVVEPHPDYRTDIDDGKPLQLAELVDLGELQKLFSAFCESVGIAAAIIDLQANILASSRWQRACTDFHRVNPESCARCIESDTELALKLEDGEDYTMYRCKNGMTDCASPIIIEGQHLANVFIGQFHLGPPDMEFFRQQARQFGYDEAAYLKAVQEAPVADEKRLPVILGFLTGFARMLSTMSLARRRADAAQIRLREQAEMLKRERVAAMSLAEDEAQARIALEALAKESRS